MIRHIVAWNFKDEISADEKIQHKERIKNELEALAGKVPGLVAIRVYPPVATGDRELVLDSMFTSEKALQLYKDHPGHVKAGEFIRSVVKDRIALDYEV